MVYIEHCVINAGSSVVNCVGAWCRCRVNVGLCAVNVGCRCVVNIGPSCSHWRWCMMNVGPCARCVVNAGPCVVNVGISVVNYIRAWSLLSFLW